MSSSPAHLVPLLLQAHQLSGGPAGHMAIEDLSFAWSAGLHWVCGDEGSGKTSLLRLLAGDLQPLAGTLQTPQGGVFWVDLKGPEHDQTTVQACWDQLQTRYPQWHNELLQDLSEALDMERHRHKPLYMLSTGSRRKVMLIAALASGATITLLDQPFASLDQVSIRVIKDLLHDTTECSGRAWIVADYEAPGDLPLTSVLNLGTAA
ncbi:MAG: ATP-binding cassette domain-containing protein [Limnohabitans sp.]|jgi:ABC-type multidrug transport system ATPase subunit|nr:ATP-binding cassette domain-containing protein [Limnohabitans sp.]MBP6244558.1 ATP-binding cassette domain-containing protein [Limnohabitans sp.]